MCTYQKTDVIKSQILNCKSSQNDYTSKHVKSFKKSTLFLKCFNNLSIWIVLLLTSLQQPFETIVFSTQSTNFPPQLLVFPLQLLNIRLTLIPNKLINNPNPNEYKNLYTITSFHFGVNIDRPQAQFFVFVQHSPGRFSVQTVTKCILKKWSKALIFNIILFTVCWVWRWRLSDVSSTCCRLTFPTSWMKVWWKVYAKIQFWVISDGLVVIYKLVHCVYHLRINKMRAMHENLKYY